MGSSFLKRIGRLANTSANRKSKSPAATLGRDLRYEPLEERHLLTATFPALLVSDTAGTAGAYVQAYNATSAASPAFRNFSTLQTAGAQPSGLTIGPAACNPNGGSYGNLYVTTGSTGAVEEFDGQTGAFVKTFVAASPDFGANNQGIAFAQDSNGKRDLFVSYFSNLQAPTIQEFDGITGARMGDFVSSNSLLNGNLTAPVGLTFGLDGNLYVADNSQSNGAYQGELLCYGGPASSSPGQFISATTFDPQFLSGQVQATGGMAVGPRGSDVGGNIFVSCSDGTNGWVEQFSNGVDLGKYVAMGDGGLGTPEGLAFSTSPAEPGGNLNLFVADSTNNCVEYYEDVYSGGMAVGQFKGNFVDNDANGLAGPTSVVVANIVSVPAATSMSPTGATITTTYGDTFSFTETLTCNGVPVPNEPVDFSLSDGSSVHDLGTVATDAAGQAVMNNIDPAGYGYLNVSFAGDAYYAGNSVLNYLSEIPATPTVTVTDAGGTYNGTPFAATGTVTGVIGDDLGTPAFTYYAGTYSAPTDLNGLTPLPGAPGNVGSYTVLASYAGNANYTAASALANFNITPCPLIVIATGQNKPYDGAIAATVTLSASNIAPQDSVTISYTTATFANQKVGTGITVSVRGITIGGSDASQYILTSTTARTMADITAIPLTITADDQSMVYGGWVPNLTATYSGFIAGESAANLAVLPTIVTTATSTSPVLGNPYSITARGAVDSNYTISYVAGTFTVTPAPLIIVADNKFMSEGEPLPPLTFTCTGLVNGDSLITEPTLSTDATADSPLGVYLISISGATASSDYSLTLVDGTLTIVADDTIGGYDSATSMFYLRDSNTTGFGTTDVFYGAPNSGSIPVVGDWDGNGTDTVGLYNPAASVFYLRNSNSSGIADAVVYFGPAGCGFTPVVGDWDGNGTCTVGLYDPTNSVFYLSNSNTTGTADIVVAYGPAHAAGFVPVVGNWDGGGADTIGLYNSITSIFYLRRSNTSGYADIPSFFYGTGSHGAKPLVGDWIGTGNDTIGLYDPSTSSVFLRCGNYPGPVDVAPFAYGPTNSPTWTPLTGHWAGWEDALMVTNQVASADVPKLTPAELQPIVNAAIARWTNAGLATAAVQKLAQVQFAISNLPGSELGLAAGNRVYLDVNAAGKGWFVDPTPSVDEEFTATSSDGQVRANDARVLDHIDLLTVVEHELGHVAGLTDLDTLANDVMNGVLGVGVRRNAAHTDAVLAC